MFFNKKKAGKKHGMPISDVQKMTKKGMSDKDIIKKLKSQGYSYDEIEAAMLQAVKSGVTEEQPTTRKAAPELPELESFYTEDQQQPLQQFETLPDLESEMPQEVEDANIMLEELVEGVIDEKWQKFSENMKKIDADIDKVRAEMKQFELKIEATRQDNPTRELEINISDINEKLEDLDARVGGLEKAFKQFLPSLTKNIESLSKMIHEMKSKQSGSTFEPGKF